MSVQTIELMRTKWLASGGVLAVNVVGHRGGPHAELPAAVAATLRAVFGRGARCFADEAPAGDGVSNNLCLASARGTPGVRRDPQIAAAPDHSHLWYIRTFLQWEVFADSDASPITEQPALSLTRRDRLSAAQRAAGEELRRFTRAQYLSPAAWAALGRASAATDPKQR
eukprot:TRINITY_DN43375_c0_g1_i3.p3 TRINITY_DN43375_c0_g1~~TRINITY_DN43375_c0_g1_i3.p3  ORF type:complete len:169 (+),score=18.58 TRINITY_DN43375_c0_g1_i3:754-1260(+)